jgi:hypothetical protein
MEPLREDIIVDIDKNRERFFGTSGKMLLPCPATVETLLKKLPENKLVTIDFIRKELANQFSVQVTCPFNTKLCLRAIANDSTKQIAYWRVIRGNGELIAYFPGSVEGHAALLRGKGFTIDYGGKKPVENPAPPPPDLVKRAQDALAASGLAGTLKVTGEGEYSCTQFLLRSVSFELSVDVADLNDTAAMKTLAARVKEFPVKEVLGSGTLGGIRIRFRAVKQFCCWDDVQGCGSAMPLSQP